MSEAQTQRCGAEIDFSRRVDFTMKNGTRVCESCFVKETPRSSQHHKDWSKKGCNCWAGGKRCPQ
jgi:hypothetical protein